MARRTRILKEMLKEQAFTTTIMQQILAPEITEALARSQVDFISIDLEHTGRTIESALPCLNVAFAYDLPALVRVYEKRQHLIEQALDAGAQGVIVPTIETAHECRDVVRAGKFAPLGERGFCPVPPASRWLNDSSPKTYINDANRDTLLVVLVETPKGIENLEDMLSVEGIDAFMLGAADYAVRIGKSTWDDDVARVMMDATSKIIAAGKICIPLGLAANIVDVLKTGTKVVQLGMSDAMAVQWRIDSEIAAIKEKVAASTTA